MRALEKKTTLLPDAVQAALESRSIRPENKEIKSELDLPTKLPKVRIDETHRKELVVDLVANALKYTSEKGEIQIRAKEKGHYISVEIQDTGIGVFQKPVIKFSQSSIAQPRLRP